MKEKSLIVILGPTAVGKTSLSVELALKLACPIISCDSRQFYKGLDIGTAKPSLEEQKGVTHYFLDFLEPEAEYTAGMFERDVMLKLELLFQEFDQVIMVGGSTLYIDAITKGFDDLPKDLILRKELIAEYENEGIEKFLEELQAKDPEYFELVDHQNAVRVLRAIEVLRNSDKKYSEMRKGVAKSRTFNIVKIGLEEERELLYNRINLRVDQMLEKGLEREAKQFYPLKGLVALKTVGYQEFFEYFDGHILYDKAVELIKRNSRRYAKRQLTWFRRDSEIEWFAPHKFNEVLSFIETKI